MEVNDTVGLGPIEGDPKGWHIRLTRRVGGFETWALWHGDEPQSSNWPKDIVLRWMNEQKDKEA